MKKDILIILVFLLVVQSVPLSYANPSQDAGVPNSYISLVKSSLEYNQYKDQITSIYVSKSAETPGGVRHTLIYNLSKDSGKNTLVFVGDDNEILYVGLTDLNPENPTLTSLVDKSIEMQEPQTISLKDLQESMRFDPNYNSNCSTYRCIRSVRKVGVSWKPLCNQIVGEPCKNLMSDPYFGPVMSAVCKAFVFVLCLVDFERECVEGVYAPVCEM